MGTITYVRTLDYVAAMIDEGAELLKVIVSDDDNLSYGNIISVYTGPDEAITAGAVGLILDELLRVRQAK